MVKDRFSFVFLFSFLFFIPIHARIVFSSIDTPGFYQLSDNLTNSVTITVSNVTFDLNGHTINATNGIVINAGLDEICIKNGVIEATADGVIAGSGCTNITLENMKVKNAIRGINFENVTGGTIANCEMTLNTTGLELDNSHKIVVKDCVASCNTHAGYCLLSSTTNTFENCKALSTGEGNADTANTTIFGFVSANGHGNIFERCTTNGTQGLSVADSDSLIAGFALRGIESCTKIIDSEAANSTINENGYTIPFGIFIESTLSGVSSVTSSDISSNAFAWSPDGKYVVAGYADASGMQVLRYDRATDGLEIVARDTNFASNPSAFSWSPDGRTISVSQGSNVQTYYFDRSNDSLNFLETVAPGFAVSRTDWSYDNNYLLVNSSDPSGDPDVIIYKFDRVKNELAQVSSSNLDAQGEWSPDGEYVAFYATAGTSLSVYRFDKSTNSLLLAASAAVAGSSSLRGVSWSSNGKYIALSDSAAATNSIVIYELDRDTESLSQIATDNPGYSLTRADWSADSRYLATLATFTGVRRLLVYKFDQSASSLSLERSIDVGQVGSAVFWSSDGERIGAITESLEFFTGLNFPSKNVIKGNTVYCNSGGICPQGVGISGSSVANMIIGNTSYSNPLPQSAHKPIVTCNYLFVPNIFNPIFGQIPSDVQNISLDGCDPVCTPEDVALLIKQTLFKVCNPIPSQLDVIESKIDTLDLNISSSLSPCAPTAISAAGIISSSGIYCLANEITGAITIAASDVDLDLNNYKVVAGTPITVSGGLERVTIRNGVVESTSGLGITASAGTSNLTIKDVIVKNASSIGISLNSIDQGVISNCQIIENDEGLDLIGCTNIYVKDCVALDNLSHGYGLLGSSTCCFENCKSLNSGTGSSEQFNNNVFGFVSENGYGNIFERCIANATQALSTTDSNSLVAGFALRGTERCTKIIDSESSNATTSSEGVTVPYGILIEPTFADMEITLTAVPAIPDSDDPGPLAWSPDGKYLAIEIGGTNPRFRIYRFDRQAGILASIAIPDVVPTYNVGSLEWSPDGVYLAVGGGNGGGTIGELNIYRFEPLTNSLTRVATSDVSIGANITSVSWRKDRKYLAISARSADAQRLRVYKFDPIQETITQFATPDTPPSDAGGEVDWHPDGRYIAISDFSSPFLHLYLFDETNATLTSFTTPTLTALVTQTQWSPDGKYLAINEQTLGPLELKIYSFDVDTATLTFAAGQDFSSNTLIDWSADSRYLATRASNAINVYFFDRGINELVFVAQSDINTSTSLAALAWSPDGAYIADTVAFIGANHTRMYKAFQYPEKNIIKNNTVYCNSGGSNSCGFGISGSSISNMIIGNTSYNNPQNYAYAVNVFDQLFGVVPSVVQNISLNGCDPICTPEDTNLLIKRISLELSSCAPTSISGPKTISDSGIYCLAENVSGAITIAASNVHLDLNNYRVTSGITVNSALDQVTISNGVVEGSTNAIVVNQGSTNITIDNVIAKNAASGINFDGVTGGTISNCEMTMNTTGLELNNSHKIVVKDCLASCNTFIGYCLLSSTTCYVVDSKALGTGEGSTAVFDTELYGFVSSNGYGNIFERCIANSTQALTATGFDSIIAGFSLQDNEGCTKIINCEASNSTASTIGVTIPYGIYIKPSFQGLSLFDSTSPGGASTASDQLNATVWSPDGQYLAVGGTLSAGSGEDLYILKFDPDDSTKLREVVAFTVTAAGDLIRTLAWSPNGRYLAVGGQFASGSDSFRVYKFDPNSSTVLTEISTLDTGGSGDNVVHAEWSPNGRFIALGGTLTGDALRVYEFVPSSGDNATTLKEIETVAITVSPQEVRWHPSGDFLAASGSGGAGSDSVFLYRFTPGLSTVLTQIDAVNPDGSTTDCQGLKWSPSGKYLAIAGNTTNDSLFVYQFNEDGSPELTQIGSTNPGAGGSTDFMTFVNWSPDGRYIVAGGSLQPSGAEDLFIYKFNPGIPGSEDVLTELEGATVTGFPRGSGWHPDGRFLAVGHDAASNADPTLAIYNVYSFPEKNIVKDNVVYCNSNLHQNSLSGVGISGSNIQNLIIQNSSYNNPTNFEFITNVFNGNSNEIPSLVQNISIDGCKPLAITGNVIEILGVLENKMCDMQSKIDVIFASF